MKFIWKGVFPKNDICIQAADFLEKEAERNTKTQEGRKGKALLGLIPTKKKEEDFKGHHRHFYFYKTRDSTDTRVIRMG